MKTGNYLRILGAGIMMGIFPVMVSANELNTAGINSFTALSSNDAALLDLIYRATPQDDEDPKKQDERNKDSKKRPEADKDAEQKPEPKVVEIDPKRPNIREVPKARPKLRPGAVTDRVKVKRPPIKGKPVRMLH